MTKATKHSITHGSEPEISSRYYNLDGEHYHLKPDEIIELGKDFLKWAQTIKKPYRAGKFFRKLGWGFDNIQDWKEKYPAFRKLYNEGKEELGDIREMGVIERKFDSTSVNSTLHLYVQEYALARKEDQEFKAKLSNDTNKPISESKEYIFVESFAEIAAKMKEDK